MSTSKDSLSPLFVNRIKTDMLDKVVDCKTELVCFLRLSSLSVEPFLPAKVNQVHRYKGSVLLL